MLKFRKCTLYKVIFRGSLVTGLDAAFKQSQPKYIMTETGLALKNPDGSINYNIQPTIADLYAYFYGGKAKDVLFGCQNETSVNYKMTTEGDNLTNVFGDQFSSLTENEKLAATKYYMKIMLDGIYNNFIEQGYSAEDARSMTVLKLANTLADNVEIGYVYGSKANADASKTQLWDGSKWIRYDNPKMDCSGFVKLVLDTMGYKVPHGVEAMVNDRNLFKNVNNGELKIGDITAFNNKSHILIVSQVENGKATQFIHSSRYNYNRPDSFGSYFEDNIGVQRSMINLRRYNTLKYYRLK